MTRKWTGLTAMLSVVMTGACADLTGPQQALQMPQFDLVAPSEVPGEVMLCVDGPAGSHSFALSQTAGFLSGFTGTLGTLPEGASTSIAAGACKLVWVKTTPYPGAPGPADVRVNLTIAHNGLPAGTLLAGIDVFAAQTPSVVAGMDVTLNPNVYHGAVVVYRVEAEAVVGSEGCTPGYWRNTRRAWPIAKSTDFDTYFGVNVFNPDRTLGTAVAAGGGGWNALGRHATAGLLNALEADVDYAMTAAQVIQLVQDAANGTIGVEAAKDQLEVNNEAGCPIPNR